MISDRTLVLVFQTFRVKQLLHFEEVIQPFGDFLYQHLEGNLQSHNRILSQIINTEHLILFNSCECF